MIQAFLINMVLKLASHALIDLMNKVIEELQQRDDNDLYEEGDSVKDVLSKIVVDKIEKK